MFRYEAKFESVYSSSIRSGFSLCKLAKFADVVSSGTNHFIFVLQVENIITIHDVPNIWHIPLLLKVCVLPFCHKMLIIRLFKKLITTNINVSLYLN